VKDTVAADEGRSETLFAVNKIETVPPFGAEHSVAGGMALIAGDGDDASLLPVNVEEKTAAYPAVGADSPADIQVFRKGGARRGFVEQGSRGAGLDAFAALDAGGSTHRPVVVADDVAGFGGTSRHAEHAVDGDLVAGGDAATAVNAPGGIPGYQRG
jgi:hypothetical protein